MLIQIKNFFEKLWERPLFFWLGLILFFALCRIATWVYPINSDHWVFYYVGKNFAQGGTLYVSAWDHKPPLIYLFNSFMHLTMGDNLFLHRIFLSVLTIFDILLFYQLLKLIVPKLPVKSSKNTYKVGLALYVFWRNLSQFTSSGNNTENFGLIFLLLMLIAFFKYLTKPSKTLMFLAGIALSFLFFLKVNFVLLGLALVVVLTTRPFIHKKKGNFKNIFVSTILFVLPTLIQGGLWTWYFWTKNALYDFYLASFLFNAKYSKSAWLGSVSSNLALPIILFVFLIPVFLYFAFFLKNFKQNIKNIHYFSVFCLFLAGIVLTLGVGSFYPYYSLIVIPIDILIFLYGISCFKQIKKIIKIPLIFVLALSVIISYGISLKQLYNNLWGTAIAEEKEFREIAKYIKENTKANDKIFLYDYGATMYILTQRNSASRFISASHLLLDEREKYNFGFTDTFISDLKKTKPKYIVMPKNKNSLYYQNKKATNYLVNNFEKEKTFENYFVMKRK